MMFKPINSAFFAIGVSFMVMGFTLEGTFLPTGIVFLILSIVMTMDTCKKKCEPKTDPPLKINEHPSNHSNDEISLRNSNHDFEG